MNATVREMKEGDIEQVIDYFVSASPSFLAGMGVDIKKLPDKHAWMKLLSKELDKPYEEKEFHYITWLIDNQPVGHSNVNKIRYGKEAFMHLHLWHGSDRKKGSGSWFVRETLPHYFERLALNTLFCEPYALNPAPNKILLKLGFEFEHTYETVPGAINFHQQVNRYALTREQYEQKMLSQTHEQHLRNRI